MSTPEKPDANHYKPLPPSEANSEPPPTYIILQYYPSSFSHTLRRILLLIFSLLSLSLLIYLLYPSDPDLRLVRVKLNHIRVHTRPAPAFLDLSLGLTLRVRNPDFFSLSYDELTVAIAYRGKKIGYVRSEGGKVKARRASYVNATLVVDGFEVMHDLIYLVEDIAAGFVPFDTVSTVDGSLGLFYFKLPIKAKVSCEVDVNPINQKIIHQNCYPE